MRRDAKRRRWAKVLALFSWLGWLGTFWYAQNIAAFPSPYAPALSRFLEERLPVALIFDSWFAFGLWLAFATYPLMWTWVGWGRAFLNRYRTRLEVFLWPDQATLIPPRMLFGFLGALFAGYYGFMPVSWNRVWAYYLPGFRPYAWVLGGTLLLYALSWWDLYPTDVGPSWRAWARRNRPVLVFGALLALLALGIGWTRIGFHPQAVAWQETAPPLVPGQVVTALAAGWGLGEAWRWLDRRRPRGRQVARGLALTALWLGTWVLWDGTPFQGDYFAQFPPPHYTYTPTSDARVFDRNAQGAVVGERVHYLYPWRNHAGLVGMYTFFHLGFGPAVPPLVRAQVVVLALLPVVLFLLGYRLHSPHAGFITAFLYLLHQRNAIELAHKITTVHPKPLMSGPWTAFFLAVATLLMIRALQRARPTAWPLAAGAVMAFVVLIRLNPFGLIPLFFLAPFLPRKRPRGRRRVVWMWVTLAVGLWMVWFPWKDAYTYILLRQPSWVSWKWLLRAAPSKMGRSLGVRPDAVSPVFFLSRVDFLLEHASHQVVTSFFHLPTFPFATLSFGDKLYKALPYWRFAWAGDLPPSEWGGVFVWLAVLALGLGAAWQRERGVGVFPALLFFGYAGAVALGSSSGGRYAMHSLWLLQLYAGIGLSALLSHLLFGESVPTATPQTVRAVRSETPGSRGWDLGAPLAVALPFFLFTLLLARYALSVRPTYVQRPKEVLWSEWNLHSALAAKLAPYRDELATFLADARVRVFYGRLLYPAFAPDRGILYFELVGHFGVKRITREDVPLVYPRWVKRFALPLTSPPSPEGVAHGQDAYVITCMEGPPSVLITVPAQGAPQVLFSALVQEGKGWTCLAR